MKPKLILPSNGRAHGWRPDTPNVNAPRLKARLSTRTRVSAIQNPTVDPALYPKIRDQDWLGCCTGFGLRSATLLKFYEKHEDKLGTGRFAKQLRLLSPGRLLAWPTSRELHQRGLGL